MKINRVSTNSSISFQKTLAAECSVKGRRKPYKCKIYKLDKNDPADKEYFTEPNRSREWDKSIFWKDFKDNFQPIGKNNYFVNDDFYVIEDDKSCLGVMEISDNIDKNNTYLRFFETNPNLTFKNINRPLQYIGETMMAFLAKLAQKQKKNIMIASFTNTSFDFYKDKCGFSYPYELEGMLILTQDSFEPLIQRNEMHTGDEIKMYV